jgi:hypothetical protein
MLISLMRRVKIRPRLASVAAFLCLMVAHLEWPDMANLGVRRNAVTLDDTKKRGVLERAAAGRSR